MQRGRRIAFDYGDVRIGVAICDLDGILASPLVTLSTGDKGISGQISNILDEYEPIVIYVGKPINMDSSDGASAQKAEAFCDLLESLSDKPIVMIDERLSTLSAARNMRESGVRAREGKKMIDQAAAVAILEFALAIERNRK